MRRPYIYVKLLVSGSPTAPTKEKGDSVRSQEKTKRLASC
jgi:hypothetical protein